MENKDKGDGIEDSPLDMLLVILMVLLWRCHGWSHLHH